MAKKKASSILKSAKVFINENDEAIEKEVYANADTIGIESKAKDGYLKKSHRAIVEALGLESIEDSKYFDYEIFHKMVDGKVKLKRERKQKSEERKEQEQRTDMKPKAKKEEFEYEDEDDFEKSNFSK